MSLRRDVRVGVVAGLALPLLALAVAGCTPSPSSGSAGSATSVSSSASSSSSSASPSPSEPSVSVDTTAGGVSYLAPVRIGVADGSFTAVQVSTGGTALDGVISGDSASWVSVEPPKPALSYDVTATVKDATGALADKSVSFTVASVPDDQKVSFTVTPHDGATVGIGQPIVVRFLTPITQRSAIEKVMLVEAQTSAGQDVAGSWHWLNSQELHWRPQEFWTPGTTVKLTMKIAGVQGAPNRYGRKDYVQTFTIGSSHVTRVDLTALRAKVYRDGKLMNTWIAGGGRPGLATYSGTYIVLDKSQSIVMDSCSARITCDKKNKDYYSEKELWATRITASGTFLHAAGWDGLLGQANVSHGCVHLADADAQDFYNHAVVGDVVIVTNSGRGPGERIATQDPGLYDWNLSWATWKAGSALK
jgi:lipoprotein-anchoring transpeptidase ErfK/SrfK